MELAARRRGHLGQPGHPALRHRRLWRSAPAGAASDGGRQRAHRPRRLEERRPRRRRLVLQPGSGLRFARRLLGPALLLAIWVVGSGTGLIPSRILPGPGAVASTASTLLSNGQLPSALAASLQRVALGLLLGIAVGTLLALGAGLTRLGDDLIDAPLQ